MPPQSSDVLTLMCRKHPHSRYISNNNNNALTAETVCTKATDAQTHTHMVTKRSLLVFM